MYSHNNTLFDGNDDILLVLSFGKLHYNVSYLTSWYLPYSFVLHWNWFIPILCRSEHEISFRRKDIFFILSARVVVLNACFWTTCQRSIAHRKIGLSSCCYYGILCTRHYLKNILNNSIFWNKLFLHFLNDIKSHTV